MKKRKCGGVKRRSSVGEAVAMSREGRERDEPRELCHMCGIGDVTRLTVETGEFGIRDVCETCRRLYECSESVEKDG